VTATAKLSSNFFIWKNIAKAEFGSEHSLFIPGKNVAMPQMKQSPTIERDVKNEQTRTL